ncbi:hypothetical protein MLD38_028828 [Melastoma candidum]|uniref:Uncharacterized protein n=1 Tax=Melastoma candidum TaxID=119954 RepID=A0ACB9N4E6_9MYRT|nr:hypothetical protein MLD38_028828 [Melastoma candidum]
MFFFLFIFCFSISLLSHFPLRCPLRFLCAPKFVSFVGRKELAVCRDGVPVPEPELSLLDLPGLALECVLEKLPPAGLCSMSAACSSLRAMCRSDRLWEKHVQQKWGGVIGEAARAEWERWVVEKSNRRRTCGLPRRKALWDVSSSLLGFSWIREKSRNEVEGKGWDLLPQGSVMSLYLSLESGQFWFPAQVYNRENGHLGFMLSCYDAHICYDSPTDTFRARYSSQGGRQTVEDGIPWNRIRSPPVSTHPYELHVSDCLNDLKPGDRIEIQWRKSKEFPYGWWYGVVGHLESCSGSEDCCHCVYSDSVTLEFNHYPDDSRWRRKVVNRRKHPEEGDQVTGFYGGIWKLERTEEITKWKSLWPSRVSV